MSFPLTPDLIAFAHKLADASGTVIRPYFRSRLGIETKGDQSPVTLADRGAEKAIRDILMRERPQDGIFGEEFGVSNDKADLVWVIDPIDGTRAFITGKPTFGTLIALMHRGKPVLGVIDQPVLRERWIGGGGLPALFNGQPTRTRPCLSLDRAYLNATTPDMFKGPEVAIFDAFRKKVKESHFGGDCIAYGLLASGHLDMVMEASLKLHDFAALVPVIEAAGGIVTDWQGQALTPDSNGQVLASGDPALHRAGLDALKPLLSA